MRYFISSHLNLPKKKIRNSSSTPFVISFTESHYFFYQAFPNDMIHGVLPNRETIQAVAPSVH
jgi:hypothetical protein